MATNRTYHFNNNFSQNFTKFSFFVNSNQ